MKEAEVADAATVMEDGVERVGLLLERATTAPPAGAALLRVTVQTLDELDPTLEGLQAREETSAGATRVTVVLEELPL